MNGGEVRQEIEEAIAYSNAKEITVQLYANEGTGSTLPSGNYTAKQGYAFEISFSENPAYSFIKWTAVLKDDSAVEVTEGITFDDIKSPVTKVKITNDTDSIKIIPVCEKRIEVSGEPSPRYEPLGVSRDRSISVSFTKPLAQNCFFFSEVEIPSGAEIKTNAEGKIWAYVYENQTYLKNITITNIDDYSIAQHFTCPEISDKLLTIAVDKTNPIEFNSGEIYKTVKVTLSKDITDTLGIKMNSAKSWNYQITESTDEKATVILGSDKGTVYLAGTKNYSIGQKITLAYTEDADYQFVRWDYDSSIIYIEDPKNINTTALVLEKTTEDSPTQIKAVCAPRLRVTDFSPVTNTSNPTVSKNSSIIITFNKNLPLDTDSKKQLENISIAIGGVPVKSSFKAPVINENTITFIADNSNMLEVSAGQTKTISVSVPADFYYKLDDGTRVTYGGNGKSFDYKIDDSTLEKAEISFAATSGAGQLVSATGTKQYSIGQEVELSFELADGWKFNGWNISCGEAVLSDEKIKILDKKSLKTKLIVNEAIQGVVVSANASQKFKVDAVSPSASINPKDSSISISFNKPLADNCSSLLNSIKVSIDNLSIDNNFATREILSTDKKIIKLTNTKYLSVADGLQKTVTVTVPSSFYYMDGSVKVPLENDYSFSFVVNSSSIAETDITYAVTPNSGSITPAPGLVRYSLDKEISITFAPATGYEFTGWTVTTSSGAAVDSSKITIDDVSKLSTKLRIHESISNVTVKANAYLIPIATTKPDYNNDGIRCDTPIEITFNTAIATSSDVNLANDGVIQIVDASNEYVHYENHFNTPVWSNGNKTLTIRPKNTILNIFSSSTDLKNLRVKVDYSKFKDSEGHVVKVAGESFWTYRIKYDMEKIAPEVKNMSLFKRGFDFTQESVAENDTYTELSSLAFENFQPETYPLNHVGKKVYFDAQVYDEGSGYNKLTINEKLIKTVGGEPVTGAQTYSVTVPFTEDDFADEISQTPSNHSYTFQTTMDGLVELDFVFADNAGNLTEKKWYVIKDTNLDSNTLKKDVPTNLMKDYKGTPDQSGQENSGEKNLYSYASRPLNSTDYYSRIANNDNKFTETMSFSNPDTYYSSKSEYANYEAYWGYDDKNISNPTIKKSNTSFSFTREVNKDCYLRIIVCDAVGNAYSEVVKIPKQNAIIGLSDYTGQGQYIFTGTFDNRIFFYKYKANENSDWSEIRIQYYYHSIGGVSSSYTSFQFSNNYFSDSKLTPDGIYAFYDIPYNKSSFGSIYGTVSDPFILYHNVTNSSSGSTPDFPDSFTCTLDAEETNASGKRNVHVSLPDDFNPTPGCNYGVYCNLVFRSFLDFDFSVDSEPDRKGKVYLRAYDSLGTMYQSSNYVDIDVTYDNIPPIFTSSTIIENGYPRLDLSAPNEILLTHKTHGANEIDYLPLDKGVGMYETEEGNIEFDYYFKKRDNDHYTPSLFSRSDLTPLVNSKKTISYPKSAAQIKLDFFEPVESGYDIILDLKDKNGNKVLKTFVVSNIVIPEILKVSVTGDASSYTVSVPKIYLDNQIRGVFDTCYLENNEWKFYNRTSNSEGKSNSFTEMKIFLRNALNGHYNSFYNFLCPAYELKSAVEKAQYCRSKSVIPGLGGAFQVFYDAPCFAHTMAFPTNKLSDLNTKAQNALDKDNTLAYETAYTAAWETKGREYGLKLLYGGEADNNWLQGNTTYIAPVNEIPAGFSYVTVFHFADGSTVISDVKQK